VNFNRRLLLCAVVPALLFVTALSASLWGLKRTQQAFDRYIGTEQAVANGLSEMYAQGLQMGQALRNIVLEPGNARAHENFSAAEAAYLKARAATEAAARGTGSEAGLRDLLPLREAQTARQAEVLALVKAGDVAAATKALTASETPAWRALRTSLLQQLDAARKSSAIAHDATQAGGDQALALALGLATVAVVAAAGLLWLMRRTVARELGGEPAQAREALRRIADGDLGAGPADGQAAVGLMGELQRTRQRLQELVAQVRTSTDSIHLASAEIATGNQDLSVRTETTAGNLQQTAGAMAVLTDHVQQGVDAAHQANRLAASAAEVARRGGAVVSQVVATMGEINDSSKQIADIVGVIDGIAFQTNILALNAAVEAARAGEQGRGFAVVASEVRSLAQRSAAAAREIKTLIGSSVDKVENGARLVADAGATMDEIVGSVQRVSDIIGEIGAASSAQSTGIGQVNGAVAQLDQMTQQNAALVEQSAAAADSLKDQAGRLSAVVGNFRLHAGA